ncbi:Sarcosine oxidase [Balamuthia mandrillaris]
MREDRREKQPTLFRDDVGMAEPRRVFDFVIVGAGMIGSSAARHLSHLLSDATDRPNRIAIIGPDEPDPKDAFSHDGPFASHYDEGRITRELDAHPVWLRLARESIRRYAAIEQEGGLPFYTGSGFLCLTQESEPYCQQVERTAKEFAVEYQRLGREELMERFPCMNLPVDCVGLFQSEQAGHISPRAFVRCQLKAAMKRGVVHIPSSVERVAQHEQQQANSNKRGLRQVMLTSGQCIHARTVIVATGAFTEPALLDGVDMKLHVQGRTVLLADVTDHVRNNTLPGLNRLPSIIQAIRSKGSVGTEDATSLYDVYLLPPVLYPDGRWYLKIGTGDFAHPLLTPSDKKEWFKQKQHQEGTAGAAEAQRLWQTVCSLYPFLLPGTFITANCALTYTSSGLPIIQEVSEGIVAAVGGNGAAAKSADEIGRLAALVALRKWDESGMYEEEVFRLNGGNGKKKPKAIDKECLPMGHHLRAVGAGAQHQLPAKL